MTVYVRIRSQHFLQNKLMKGNISPKNSFQSLKVVLEQDMNTNKFPLPYTSAINSQSYYGVSLPVVNHPPALE